MNFFYNKKKKYTTFYSEITFLSIQFFFDVYLTVCKISFFLILIQTNLGIILDKKKTQNSSVKGCMGALERLHLNAQLCN